MRSKFIVPALALGFIISAQAQTTQKIAVLDMQGALLQTGDGQKAGHGMDERGEEGDQDGAGDEHGLVDHHHRRLG